MRIILASILILFCVGCSRVDKDVHVIDVSGQVRLSFFRFFAGAPDDTCAIGVKVSRQGSKDLYYPIMYLLSPQDGDAVIIDVLYADSQHTIWIDGKYPKRLGLPVKSETVIYNIESNECYSGLSERLIPPYDNFDVTVQHIGQRGHFPSIGNDAVRIEEFEIKVPK